VEVGVGPGARRADDARVVGIRCATTLQGWMQREDTGSSSRAQCSLFRKTGETLYSREGNRWRVHVCRSVEHYPVNASPTRAMYSDPNRSSADAERKTERNCLETNIPHWPEENTLYHERIHRVCNVDWFGAVFVLFQMCTDSRSHDAECSSAEWFSSILPNILP